jgi:hypothetical protein
MVLVWTTKEMEDGGRSEEKRDYAINSKQKSTKNLFLVGSFLTCWLAGLFCQNLPLSTNDLEDGGEASRKGEWDFFWGTGIFFWGGGRGVPSLYKPKIWGMGAGQRRRGAMLSMQSKKSTKNSFLVGSFLTCWLASPFCQNLLLSTNDLDDVACRKGRRRI